MTFDQSSTLIAVIEISPSSRLVAGVVPEMERHPLKMLEVVHDDLLQLLDRWSNEAAMRRKVAGIAVAFAAGRDGQGDPASTETLEDNSAIVGVLADVTIVVLEERAPAREHFVAPSLMLKVLPHQPPDDEAGGETNPPVQPTRAPTGRTRARPVLI